MKGTVSFKVKNLVHPQQIFLTLKETAQQFVMTIPRMMTTRKKPHQSRNIGNKVLEKNAVLLNVNIMNEQVK